jgi:hypothetical protein
MTDARCAGAAGRPVCLVLMPMYAGFEEIRACVARALHEAGFEMRRLEVEIGDSAWHLWLLDSVDASDVVLVDLTDHNPFVMYELGYVHHRQLPTTFIVDAWDQRVPATVRGSVCTPYGEGCQHFERDLIDHLRQLWRARAGVQERSRVPLATCSSALYRAAITAAIEFGRSAGRDFSSVDEAEFRSRLTVAERRGTPDPRSLCGRGQARHLLTLLLEESDRVDVMRAICEWSFERDPRHALVAD